VEQNGGSTCPLHLLSVVVVVVVVVVAVIVVLVAVVAVVDVPVLVVVTQPQRAGHSALNRGPVI
jgi:hypothetical protein